MKNSATLILIVCVWIFSGNVLIKPGDKSRFRFNLFLIISITVGLCLGSQLSRMMNGI